MTDRPGHEERTGLDEATALVSGPGLPARRVLRIGPPAARTHLVISEPDADRHPSYLQRELGAAMCGAQLRWLLRALAIDCVLDVGANEGQFATGLRRGGYTGRIVSFEPVAAPLAVLRAAAGDDPDWHVWACALGEVEEQVEINAVDGEATLSSLLATSDFGHSWKESMRETRAETVDVRRLDALLDEVTTGLVAPRILLKLDTQGYDLHAFRGVGERIGEVAALMSEVSCVPIYDAMPTMAEQLAAYGAAGFELSGMYPVSYDLATLRVIELDALLLRPGAVVAPG